MPEHLDLRYGTAERERIDFFAASRRDAPTLVFIDGGYWQSRAKKTFGFVAEGPLAQGVSVATIGYTLAPAARRDAIVAQCRTAVHFLHRRLNQVGGDPRRLFVSGWSAGGHLTAMLMGDAVVTGGIAISGIYDLAPIRLSYLNDKLRLDPEEALRNSPLFHLPQRAGRLILAVGGDELPELRRQSETYAAAWQARNLAGKLMVLPGRHHYSVLEELARPASMLAEALARLVG